jgi:RNA polymerase sigma factor (sigma-70 family)
MTKTDLFLSVIEANKGIIYKVANSYFKDKEDREDLVQEIIIKLWKAFDSYDEQFKFSTWIYRIALNTAISYYRKEKIKENNSLPFSESLLYIADNEDSLQNEEKISFLNQFISELKELDKALMILYLEEKSHREIAEIIGISESNVATKIGRIKSILKEKFSKINT